MTAKAKREREYNLVLPGLQVHGWLIIDHAPSNSRGRAMVLARCTCCGTEKVVLRYDIERGASRDCGCTKKSRFAQDRHKHGEAPRDARSRTFRRWKDLRARYRGRYAPEWDDFTVFLRDMGHLPVGHIMRVVDRSKPVTAANLRYVPKKSDTRKNVARDMRRAAAREAGLRPS